MEVQKAFTEIFNMIMFPLQHSEPPTHLSINAQNMHSKVANSSAKKNPLPPPLPRPSFVEVPARQIHRPSLVPHFLTTS